MLRTEPVFLGVSSTHPGEIGQKRILASSTQVEYRYTAIVAHRVFQKTPTIVPPKITSKMNNRNTIVKIVPLLK